MRKINWKVLVTCLVVVYSVAFIGSLFGDTGGWYESTKSSITPPNWVFPIVWNILFFLIALSLYLAYTSSNKKERWKIVAVFEINLVLNLLWSIFFFGMRNPLLSYIDIWPLWLSIWFIVFITYKINKTSAYLLIPYLLWVGFAIVLNHLIAF